MNFNRQTFTLTDMIKTLWIFICMWMNTSGQFGLKFYLIFY